jgi:hypothetical protein
MNGMWRLTGMALALCLFSAGLTARTPSTGPDSCSQSANLTHVGMMSSYAASCCMCFRKASCAFAISGSSPTGDAPRSCHFAVLCSAQRRKQSKISHAAKTQAAFGSAQNVVDRCRSSRGLLLSTSNSVLHLPWSLLPHETTLYNTKLLRTSARAVSLCLAHL